ncbi:hypothetical protein EYC80_001384 [Monilinia laxa]|uniref:Uncharacterized protein n=1 Tax=Monilinia laxa TaxID=61186 RepID=A0A5N6K939_MONLA|nr:hypothetical protein EYC80_001384 [Monilinia laxa]
MTASTATKGPDSHLYNEDVCQGSMGLCAANPNRNCPCISMIPDVDYPQLFDLDFLDWQQILLMSINITAYAPSKTSSTAIAPGCSFEIAALSKASPGSSKSMVSNIVCKCNGTEQIKPIYAVSGTNTTSWCDAATPVPSGFTQVSATTGSLVSSTISNTCSFVTTSYPKAIASSSSTSMIPATLCQCAHGDQLGPATAVPKVSSTTSSTSTILPSPTAEVLLIWSVPLKTGIVTYDAFLVPLGYSHNLNTDCTQVVALDNKIIPVLDAVPDPTYIVTTTVKGKPTTTTVDVESLPSGRPAGGLERRAPHSLGKLIGYDCTYEEPRFPEGSIKCGETIWLCHLPKSDEEDSITPDYGSCGDIRNDRPLVMVCPANLVKG